MWTKEEGNILVMDIDLWHSDKNSGIQHDDNYLVGDFDVHADDIMMKCLCVCNEKLSLIRAERRRREVRRPLGLAGRRHSVHDDDVKTLRSES